MASKKESQEKFLKHFEKNACNIKTTCIAIGVSRSRYYEWCKEDTFKKLADDIVEGLIDDVESQLYLNIMDGKEASIFFFLKTRGKKRGYMEQDQPLINRNVTIEMI